MLSLPRGVAYLALPISGLFALLLLGVPVAFALGAASLLALTVMGLPPVVAIQRMMAGMDNFNLLAIPSFIFAGQLMAQAGIADRLARVVTAALGRIRGGRWAGHCRCIDDVRSGVGFGRRPRLIRVERMVPGLKAEQVMSLLI